VKTIVERRRIADEKNSPIPTLWNVDVCFAPTPDVSPKSAFEPKRKFGKITGLRPPSARKATTFPSE
jgi:hypothetical protein